jgi:hypothetical protein
MLLDPVIPWLRHDIFLELLDEPGSLVMQKTMNM